jgi:hypothetical protein
MDNHHPGNASIAEGPPSTPAIERDEIADDASDIRKDVPDAMQIFFAWEKLRLLFNAILTVVTVAIILWEGASVLVLVLLIGEAVVINLCFCAGPVGEGYLAWIGLNRTFVRWSLFAVGTIVTGTVIVGLLPSHLAMIQVAWAWP